MSFLLEDITNFKPTHTYYLEVDLEANRWMKTGIGVDLFMPEEIVTGKQYFR